MPLTTRLLTGAFALGVLAACDQPLDMDMRGATGGFSTAPAVQAATASRPAADSRGIISYPTYQVAVARRGDTIDTVAARIGADPAQLARFNGIDRNVPLRQGEVIALPGRVSEPAPGTAGAIDITTLAGSAIDASPATPRVTTTPLQPTAATPAAPRAAGEPIRHKVSRGETAYTISRLYQVPVRSLAEWNGLGPDFAIREGQYLLIPVANQPAPVQSATVVSPPGEGSATPTPPSASQPLPQERVAPAATRPVTPPVTVGTPTQSSRAAMAMPLQGKIIRDYRKGANEGIDIAAAPGSPVKAAADGTVLAVSQDANQMLIVFVRHPDNLITVYANVDGISVAKGDRVKRGQQIAKLRSGDNAYLHFEVRDGFESVDPNLYLN